MADVAAVRLALDVFRGSLRPQAALKQKLPEGMLTLIKLAGGEDKVLLQVSEDMNEKADTLQEACACMLELVLSKPNISDWMLLGLDQGAPLEKINQHKRALLKWLHPDRNKNSWQSAYFKRVSAAAERLELLPADVAAAEPSARVRASVSQPTARPATQRQRTANVHRPTWHVSNKRERKFDVQRLIWRSLKVAVSVAVVTVVAVFVHSHWSAENGLQVLLGSMQ